MPLQLNWDRTGGGMSVPIGQPRGRTVMSNVASSMRKMSHLFGSGLGAVTHIFHTLSWNFHMLKILTVFITVEIWRRSLLTMYLTSVSKNYGVHTYFSILGSNSISESKNVLHEHLTVNLLLWYLRISGTLKWVVCNANFRMRTYLIFVTWIS